MHPHPSPSHGFRPWLRSLLNLRTAGMGPDTPEAKILPFLLMLLWMALQATARYKFDFLPHSKDQAWHILIGWTACFGIYFSFHGPGPLRRISKETYTLLAVAITALLLYWYFGRSDGYYRFFGPPPAARDTLWPIAPFLYFVGMGFLLRVFTPYLAMRLFFNRRFADFGLPWRRNKDAAVRHIGWVYVVFFLGMAPVLYAASQTAPYMAKYPLSRAVIGPEGVIWIGHYLTYEIAYLLSFLAAEAFFRGFLTFGLEKDFGLYALAFMVVPYVTVHFGKPLSETLGAILAGCALGFLALRHRSVWAGVALHAGIALSMDLLSIYHNGFTFSLTP